MNFFLNSMVKAARSMNSGPIISTFVAIHNGLNDSIGLAKVRAVTDVSTYRDDMVLDIITIEGERRVVISTTGMDRTTVEFITGFFDK